MPFLLYHLAQLNFTGIFPRAATAKYWVFCAT